MNGNNRSKKDIFARAREAIGDLTPLEGIDCGLACRDENGFAACCAGEKDSGTGMLLFPGEPTVLDVIENENGRFAVCDGHCSRENRPLACMIFPLYPALDMDGEVTALIDGRGARLCPLVRCCDDVDFDGDFLDAVEEAGRILAGDPGCAAAMREAAAEIEKVNGLLFGEDGGEG